MKDPTTISIENVQMLRIIKGMWLEKTGGIKDFSLDDVLQKLAKDEYKRIKDGGAVIICEDE